MTPESGHGAILDTNGTPVEAGSPSNKAVEIQDRRSNNFDFLRVILALLVIYYHSFVLLKGVGTLDQIGWITHGQIQGAIAVEFFFFLSGFLVTSSWEHCTGFRDYIRRRILRIYPAFIVSSLFCAFVVGPLATANVGAYFHQLLAPIWFAKFIGDGLRLVGPYLLPLFDTVPFPHSVNGSYWSIRYEFYCYLLVAAIGAAGLIRRRVVLAFFVALMAWKIVQQGFGVALLPDHEYKLIGNPITSLGILQYFVAGMLFYTYRGARVFKGPLPVAAAVVILITASLCMMAPMVMPLCGTYLIYRIAMSDKIKVHNFAKYGDFSYGLYLYAFPVQQLLILYFGHRLNWLTLFASASVITFVLAFLSWHLVEKLALRLKGRVSTKSAGLK